MNRRDRPDLPRPPSYQPPSAAWYLVLRDRLSRVVLLLRDRLARINPSVKAHARAAFYVAILFIAADILGFLLHWMKSGLGSRSLLNLALANGWDSAFLTVLLFIAVDLGAKIARADADPTQGEDGTGVMSHLKRYLFVSLSISAAVLPGFIRFLTAIPLSWQFRFSLWNFFVHVLLSSVVILIALGFLGGLVSLTVRAGRELGIPPANRGGLLFAIPVILFTGFYAVSRALLGAYPFILHSALGAGGVSTAASNFAYVHFDFGQSYFTNTLIGFVKFVGTILVLYFLLALIIYVVKVVALSFLKRRKAAPGGSLILPVVASGLTWTAALFAMMYGRLSDVGISPVPRNDASYEPAGAVLLSGLGLALMLGCILGWVWDSDEPDGAWVMTFFRWLLVFTVPGLFVIWEVSSTRILEAANPLSFMIVWLIFACVGVYLVLHFRNVRQGIIVGSGLSSLCAVFLLVTSVGAYGTQSFTDRLWRSLDPYPSVESLLSGVGELSAVMQWGLFLALVLLLFAPMLKTLAFGHLPARRGEPSVG